jgi:hypothetical protein
MKIHRRFVDSSNPYDYGFHVHDEKGHVHKRKQYLLFALAATFVLFWIIGTILKTGGVYVNILLVAAVAITLYTAPGVYRRFNVKHHV